MGTNDISKRYQVTKQALCTMLRKGRINGTKEKGKWHFSEDDYLDFIKTKYRRNSKLFDKSKGLYSVKDISITFSFPLPWIYYHLKKNHIKYMKEKSAYVIQEQDILNFISNYHNNKHRKNLCY